MSGAGGDISVPDFSAGGRAFHVDAEFKARSSIKRAGSPFEQEAAHKRHEPDLEAQLPATMVDTLLEHFASETPARIVTDAFDTTITF